MVFSKTIVQGVYVLCYLSRQAPGTVVPASPIAEAMNVPSEQAAKILQALARAGVIRSVRGRRGGYALEKKPEEITLNELIAALSSEPDQASAASRPCPVAPEQACSAYDGLARLRDRIREFLGKETLAPLITSSCDVESPLFTADSRRPERSQPGQQTDQEATSTPPAEGKQDD